MRTIPGVASNRATAPRRIARAQGAYDDDWTPSVRSFRRRLPLESPLGMLAVCLASLLVLTSALLPFRFAPFQFALESLIGFSAVQHPSADARVGKIIFTPFDGNACRKVLFYNQTGAFGPDQHIRCYGDAAGERDVVSRGAVRNNLIKQAFTFPGTR